MGTVARTSARWNLPRSNRTLTTGSASTTSPTALPRASMDTARLPSAVRARSAWRSPRAASSATWVVVTTASATPNTPTGR